MKREELIAYDKWLTRRKWGTGEIISPEKAADLYLAEHPLPPAEGAEEVQPTAYEWHNLKTGHCYVDYVPHLDAKEGYTKIPLYTTLHAQQMAEKMVEERLRKELVKYCNRIFDDDEFIEKSVNEYLKSR